jgi:hypothetical protein
LDAEKKREKIYFPRNKSVPFFSIKKAHARKNNWIRERVYIEAPDGPLELWRRHAHKAIAACLNISNKLAQACIDDLLMRNRLPKKSKNNMEKRKG